MGWGQAGVWNDGGLSANPIARYFQLTGVRAGLIFRGDSLAALMAESTPYPTLVAAGAATEEQALPTSGTGEPNDSPLMVQAYQYTNTNGTYHQVADTSVGDEDGSRSWSVDLCWRTTANGPLANAAQFAGKRKSTAPTRGWEWQMSTDGMITIAAQGADDVLRARDLATYNSQQGQNKYADAQWHWSCAQFDISANEIRVATEHEKPAALAWPLAGQNLTTAGLASLRFGGVRAFSAPIQLALAVFSYGDEAVQDDVQSRALQLAADTHLVQQLNHRNAPPL